MKDVSGRYRPAALLLLVPALALALALGGCGGGDGKGADAGRPSAVTTATPSLPASSSASAPRGAATPGPGAGGPPAATVVPRPSGVALTAFNAFAGCMRRHGIDFPDAGQTYTPAPAQDPAKARIALAACEKLLRGRGPAAE